MRTLVLLAALACCAGCTTAAPLCSTTNCVGCCDSSGTCQAGVETRACGSAGLSCRTCGLTDDCRNGACIPLVLLTGGGIAGGGIAGGGIAGGGIAGGGVAGGGVAGGGALILTDGGPSFCDLVQVDLRFGAVTVGTSRTLTYSVDNSTSQPLDVTITPSTGAEYTVAGATGTLSVAPGQRATVNVTFAPVSAGQLLASLRVRRAATCPERSALLIGRGLSTSLEWDPTTIDFGYVPPGTTATQPVLFRNGSSQDVTLTNLQLREGSFPSTVFTRTTPSASIVVPAYSDSTAEFLGFRPAVLGPRLATLSFTAPAGPATIALRGIGGGPRIGAPATLDFGRVPLFAGAMPPSSQTRTLTVRNVGSSPVPPDPRANLVLGTVFSGRPGQLPLFELIPGPNTSAGEFSVVVNVPPTGLDTKTPGTIIVTLTPSSLGMKSAELRIFSNDPATPTLVVHLRANVVALSPCTLSVLEPTPLDFGRVDPGLSKRRGVTLQNASSAPCLLSDVRTTTPEFSITGGPLTELELMPGERRTLLLEVRPMSASASLTGQLRAWVSSPTSPELLVPLTASAGTDCLVFSTRELDFGNNALNCLGATRTVQVINRCQTSLQLTGASVSGAGFTLVSAPPTGALNSNSAPVPVSLSWRTTRAGPEVGTLLVTSTQSGQPVTSVLLLRGASGAPVDVFPIPAKPKADVLLVVDDSCSMGDKHQAMSMNVASLLAYPAASQVDFQIGLTTTDLDLVAQAGQLRGTPLYLTGVSVNLTTTLGQRIVDVGTSGSGREQTLAPAVAALFPPLSTTTHAGFVRDDASLGVIGLSDADDQSPLPVSTYALLLASLKAPNLFTFSALTPLVATSPLPMCGYDLAPGTRTQAAVAQLGGVAREICTSTWAASLEDIGTSAFGFRTNFTLRAPVETGGAPVRVFVDNVEVPATTAGGNAVWAFSSVTNTVTFEPLYAPEPGKTLSVSYPVVCLP
jgi:hypothetical protein